MTALTPPAVEPALLVESLTVGYDGDVVVSGISFSVQRGEVVALVGESGSGKSTTAHAILGLLPPDARVAARAVRVDGDELSPDDDERMRAFRGVRLAYVPQDPGTSLDPVRRVRDQVAEVLRVHGIGTRADRRDRVDDALRAAGIDDVEGIGRRFPHELSGGLQQRVLIAQALVGDPGVLIADEPTSALDVTVQKAVLDALAAATRERGVAVLLITHDLAMAAERADRVLVLRDGSIVEDGEATRVLTRPEHAYTRELVAATPAAIPVVASRQARAPRRHRGVGGRERRAPLEVFPRSRRPRRDGGR
ncbi:ABC transporter ATP-binding protein [Microbacterium hatanonis]|uniref:ABC transporter ATP-binding protein n=1 Tax=Microbacterium hatanonis TaxID=404366 RepID=UPI001FE4B423|nr:ABC transporter ATP-binding protein [Microbacterium hatanonis]